MSATIPTRPRRARDARAGRYALSPATRPRGQETFERFLAATEDLLVERTFEQVSIHDIVARAGRPIGSFYARFASKEALLPCLYARYDGDLDANVERWLGSEDWPALGFRRAVEAVVRGLVGLYLERRWLLRAMALFARATPEAIPPDVFERRSRLFARMALALEPYHDRIAHPDPGHAVRFGLFVVMSAAREKLLFGEAPHARVTDVSRTRLERELARVLEGYLAARPELAPARSRPVRPAAPARRPSRRSPAQGGSSR